MHIGEQSAWNLYGGTYYGSVGTLSTATWYLGAELRIFLSRSIENAPNGAYHKSYGRIKSWAYSGTVWPYKLLWSLHYGSVLGCMHEA